MDEILCGSSCVKYILNCYNKKQKINPKMQWISELGLSLLNNGIIDINVFCYNSKLYNDYLLFGASEQFEGFNFLNELEKNVKVIQKELTKKDFINEIKENQFLILCVDSKIFNSDTNMTGGHFIVINGMNNNKVNVINPIKQKYELLNLKTSFLIKCCKNFGSWRILIGGKND